MKSIVLFLSTAIRINKKKKDGYLTFNSLLSYFKKFNTGELE
ncbi:hypothetical protein [Carboxylicivirga sp. N1Y90]